MVGHEYFYPLTGGDTVGGPAQAYSTILMVAREDKVWTEVSGVPTPGQPEYHYYGSEGWIFFGTNLTNAGEVILVIYKN